VNEGSTVDGSAVRKSICRYHCGPRILKGGKRNQKNEGKVEEDGKEEREEEVKERRGEGTCPLESRRFMRETAKVISPTSSSSKSKRDSYERKTYQNTIIFNE